jgi:hypothetical protein
LLLAVAATLVLGIVPNEVFHAAQSGAQVLQSPASTPVAPALPVKPLPMR